MGQRDWRDESDELWSHESDGAAPPRTGWRPDWSKAFSHGLLWCWLMLATALGAGHAEQGRPSPSPADHRASSSLASADGVAPTGWRWLVPVAEATREAELADMAGQMVLLGVRGKRAEGAELARLSAGIREGTIGGILVTERRTASRRQLAGLVASLRREQPALPLLVAIDRGTGAGAHRPPLLEGIVVSDDLDAAARAGDEQLESQVARVITAGSDLVLVSGSVASSADIGRRVRDSILAAVASGRVERTRIEEAHARILALKSRLPADGALELASR